MRFGTHFDTLNWNDSWVIMLVGTEEIPRQTLTYMIYSSLCNVFSISLEFSL